MSGSRDAGTVVRVFISWSGASSRQLAEALRDWLPSVLHVVEPYMSAEDIAKGARWPQEVARQLDESEFGIICVTRDNQRSEWLNFEAGALSKSVLSGRVVPLLLGVDEIDPRHPLWQFQSVTCERADVLRLVRDINKASLRALPGDKVQKSFDMWWPDLAARLADISRLHPAVSRAIEQGAAVLTAQPDAGAVTVQRVTVQRASADDIGADLLREFGGAFTALMTAFDAFSAELNANGNAGDSAAEAVNEHLSALKAVYDKAVGQQSPRHAMQAGMNKQRRLGPGTASTSI
jgi:hypothetical protein